MTDIHIPPEALAGAERAYGDCNCPACKKAVRRVAEGLLKAWPGMLHMEPHRVNNPAIILPLPPTEASDGNTLVDTISDEAWRHDSSGDNCNATDPQEASDEDRLEPRLGEQGA